MKGIVFTLGCKVNEVESGQIMTALESLGLEVSDKLEFADLYVLNTCAVTAEAEKKSRQLVARAKKFNPQAKIYVCGCASQKDNAPYFQRGASGVFGTADKFEVVKKIAEDYGLNLPCEAQSFYPKQTKTRAFIKIADGCNNFCSYCIIPYLRGRVNSRKSCEIIKEIESCTSQEIVITAINLSAYNDGECDFAGLIEKLAFCNKRIRLGSIECRVIDERLLSTLKKLPDFAPQFHLSLQSGSDAVLKSMNRRYTATEYKEKCALIYKFFPDAAITTDIIVGFPTEQEKDFLDSVELMKTANFSRVHAFAFSPREGTVAHKMKDLPANVKSDRLHRLITLAKEQETAYITARIGKTYPVIFEEFDGEYTDGYTPNYIKIYIKGDCRSQKIDVKLVELFKDGALAIKE